jgi:hypothetical protein
VPFENVFQGAKQQLLDLVGPVRNGLAELEGYWLMNQLFTETSVIYYALDKTDVRSRETMKPRAFFDRMRATKRIASECQGKVEIMFSGYDDDSRELFEIPEVRAYVATLDAVLPDLLFFAKTEKPTYTLSTFALCQIDVKWVNSRQTRGGKKQILYDVRQMGHFLDRHTPYLNQLAEWVGMPMEEQERVYFDIVRCLGLPVGPGEG